QHEPTLLIEYVDHFLVGVDPRRFFVAEIKGAFVYRLLDVVEQRGYRRCRRFEFYNLFLPGIAPGHFDCTIPQVARPDGASDRHALQLVFRKREAGVVRVAVIALHWVALATKVGTDRFDPRRDGRKFFLVSEDRHNNHMDRRQFRRKNQAVIVGMREDQRANEAGTDAPRGSPYVFQFSVLAGELYIKSLREILSEEVGCASLQRLAILHHGLYAIGVDGSREFFSFALLALVHGHRHVLLGEGCVHIEHLKSFLYRFFGSSMCCMALLP